MVKGIKDCMKNWIQAHERAYWYIVFGIAIGLFALITAIGIGKVHSAEAAQNVQVMLDGQTNTYSVPDVTDWDWSSWLATEQSQRYISPELIKDDIQNNFTYMVVLYKADTNTYEYYFGKSPLLVKCSSVYISYQYQPFGSIKNRLEEDYRVSVSMANGVPVVSYVEGLEDNYNHTTKEHEEMFFRIRNMHLIGSNYDMFAGYTGTYDLQVKANVIYNNLEHPVADNFTGFYDPELPYITYDSHYNINVVQGAYKRDLDESSFILNYGLTDGEYSSDYPHRIESNFYIWLPSPEYIQGLADYYASNYAEAFLFDRNTDEQLALRKQIKDDINKWQKNVGKDSTSVLYKMKRTYPCPGDLSELDDILRWDLDYQDIFDILEDMENEFIDVYGFGDSDNSFLWEMGMKNITFGHMYIYRIDNVLFEERPRGDFYNGITTFSFLINGECVVSRVVGDVLADDNADDIIDNAINQGMKDYLDKLDGDVNDLQNQLNSITSVQDAFDGSLEDTDLWTSFKSLGDGLTGLVPALRSVSAVIGGVFAFIPAPVQNIMAFTLVALCVIALIKAIRG